MNQYQHTYPKRHLIHLSLISYNRIYCRCISFNYWIKKTNVFIPILFPRFTTNFIHITSSKIVLLYFLAYQEIIKSVLVNIPFTSSTILFISFILTIYPKYYRMSIERKTERGKTWHTCQNTKWSIMRVK